MQRLLPILGLTVLIASVHARAAEQPPVRVEHSKSLPRPEGGLATQFYEATDSEKAVTKDWKPRELAATTDKVLLKDVAVGQRVGWFGIVREMREEGAMESTHLLVEMKYFDGLTDTHQQIVSICGGGDFVVVIPGKGYKIRTLELVRVYGTVSKVDGGVPHVAAEYVRCWDWGQFAFMNYGKDKGNEKWAKLRQIDPMDAYDSAPNDRYYEQRLGKC
jgi:hypothetical protein